MKNVKLTLAATLSVLAMTFTGTAFADGMDRHYSKKGFNTKSQVSKKVDSQTFKHTKNKKSVKRVIVKKTPHKRGYITKKVVKKRVPTRYAKNKRFNQGKKYNKRVSYKNRRAIQNRQNRHHRFKAGKAKKRFVYSVRPGDTLYRISLRTGVSVNKLARMNRLNNGRVNNLQIGQLLRLG